MTPPRARVVVLTAAWWLLLTLPLAALLFFNTERTVLLAGHRATLAPMLERAVTVQTGPVLPDVRLPLDTPIGVDIDLGATEAGSTAEQIELYAAVVAYPAGQIDRVERALRDLAISALIRGGALAVIPVLVWHLAGVRRRRELRTATRTPAGVAVAAVLVLIAAGLWQPWGVQPAGDKGPARWRPVSDFVGREVPLPEGLAGLQLSGDINTEQSAQLIESGLGTIEASTERYRAAAAEAARLQLHRPATDETVALLLTDRHDNVGMDQVHRAVADAAGATVVFTGGDDTSTGNQWEAFSLDSLSATFERGFDRFGVSGNHDYGGFVTDYLGEQGWRMLDYEVVDGPGGSALLGADDPRSSGLGAWRADTGTSFSDVEKRLADLACGSDRRIATLLVHDANLGREALNRGCVDLVVGGHVHVRIGPTPVVGDNGSVGYSYTNGTSGGAAYAIALGKTRRDATSTLITYRGGRPVGLQWVVMQTNNTFVVGDYVELEYDAAQLAERPDLNPSPEPAPPAPEETATSTPSSEEAPLTGDVAAQD